MVAPINIVTWLWKPTGWRDTYSYFHVNALYHMLCAYVKVPFKLHVVTDIPQVYLFHPEIHVHPLWNEPHIDVARGHPNCWKRLYAFSKDAKYLFGDRFMSIDLDVVIMDGITDIVTTKEPFKILQGVKNPYNGSIWIKDADAHNEVWDTFDPKTSPIEAKETGVGSDQAWIATVIKDAPKWTRDNGIFQFMSGYPRDYKGVKMIFFAGSIKPWDRIMRKHDMFLYDTYRGYVQK